MPHVVVDFINTVSTELVNWSTWCVVSSLHGGTGNGGDRSNPGDSPMRGPSRMGCLGSIIDSLEFRRYHRRTPIPDLNEIRLACGNVLDISLPASSPGWSPPVRRHPCNPYQVIDVREVLSGIIRLCQSRNREYYCNDKEDIKAAQSIFHGRASSPFVFHVDARDGHGISSRDPLVLKETLR